MTIEDHIKELLARAAECRRWADGADDPRDKARFEKLAEEWEAMARNLPPAE